MVTISKFKIYFVVIYNCWKGNFLPANCEINVAIPLARIPAIKYMKWQ